MKSTDLFVVGGGPAGLVAAIAARRRGLSVIVADGAQPPIDKACGEGLMPGGLAALRRLGLDLTAEDGAPFTGIRFSGYGRVVHALFPEGHGVGIRRVHLHERLIEHAKACGVEMMWGIHPSLRAASRAEAAGEEICFRYLVGADGASSTTRHWAGLDQWKIDKLRFGFRRHYEIAPWSDFVEVYWRPTCQAYLTPVAPNLVCVALLTSDPHQRLESSLGLFPELEERLSHARGIGPERGSPTYSRRLKRVARGNVALVGDASGSVDAVTGEGMSLAFRQAVALSDALASGNLASYEQEHVRIRQVADRMASLMLLMDRSEIVCRRTMRALAGRPRVFASLLEHHLNGQAAPSFARVACELGWSFVTT